MAQNWDLYLLDPLLVLFGFLSIIFVIYKERLSLKWIAFGVETILFWVACGIIIQWNTAQLGWKVFSTPVQITLLFFGTNSLFLVFLKPLATFLTGKIHHRRVWMYFAGIMLFLATIFTFVNKNGSSIALFVVIALFLALALSANSLFFLFENEQFYYRAAPTLSVTVISVFILFGTFFGSYLAGLEINLTQQQHGYNHVVLYSLTSFFLVLSALFSLVNFKEDVHYVSDLDDRLLAELPQFNWKILVWLIGVVFAFSLIFATTQSDLITTYLTTRLLNRTNFNLMRISAFLRTYQVFFVAPQFLFGYLIYKFFIEKFGFRSLIINSIGICFAALIVSLFADEPIVYLIFNFFLGMGSAQIFYACFAMAILWNYRTQGIPATGLVSAAQTFAQFIINTVIKALKLGGVGIFNVYQSIWKDSTLDVDKINQYNNEGGRVVVILLSVMCGLLIAMTLVSFFSMKLYFADTLNINEARANAKRLLKTDLQARINHRSSVEELNSYGAKRYEFRNH